jgi:hypothetical protein
MDCIARTLVQDHHEVPMRVLNATCHDQKLTKGFPVTLWASHAGDTTQCGTSTGPQFYPEVTGCDCSGKAKLEWCWILRVGRAPCLVQWHLCYEEWWLRADRQTVLLYGYVEGPTNLPTPEGTPFSKIDGYGCDARGHATVWCYRRVRRLLVILISSSKRRTGTCASA